MSPFTEDKQHQMCFASGRAYTIGYHKLFQDNINLLFLHSGTQPYHMNKELPRFSAELDNDKAVVTGRFVSHDNTAIDELFDDLTQHFTKHAPKTDRFDLTLYLDYMNTWSRKRLVRCLSDLNAIAEATGAAVTVRWVTDEDDEDMVELGEILQESCNLNFEFLVSAQN